MTVAVYFCLFSQILLSLHAVSDAPSAASSGVASIPPQLSDHAVRFEYAAQAAAYRAECLFAIRERIVKRIDSSEMMLGNAVESGVARTAARRDAQLACLHALRKRAMKGLHVLSSSIEITAAQHIAAAEWCDAAAGLQQLEAAVGTHSLNGRGLLGALREATPLYFNVAFEGVVSAFKPSVATVSRLFPCTCVSPCVITL